MTLKKKGNLGMERVIKEMDYLNKHQVVIGVFGEDHSRILTITRALEYGAHIEPKNGEYLWVPSRAAIKKYGRSVTPKDIDNDEHMFVPKGKHVAVVKKTKGKGKDAEDTLVIYFYLLKEVKIEPRPFLRKAAESNRKKYAKLLQDGLADIVYKGDTGEHLLQDLGKRGVSDVRKTMREWKTPGNKPLTIENKKGSDDPLIDTGKLVQSITWKILPVGGMK